MVGDKFKMILIENRKENFTIWYLNFEVGSSGLSFQVENFGLGGSGFSFQVENFELGDSGFFFQVENVEFGGSGFSFEFLKYYHNLTTFFV